VKNNIEIMSKLGLFIFENGPSVLRKHVTDNFCSIFVCFLYGVDAVFEIYDMAYIFLTFCCNETTCKCQVCSRGLD
jgi:hypothetical protein